MKLFKSLLFILLIKYISFSQCNLPPINLGNDTILCNGQSLDLLIGDMYFNSSWNNGVQGNGITVTEAGTYEVTSAFQGNNLIINGDFEQGNTSFSTEYILGSVEGGGPVGLLSDVQTYEITTSPSLVHNNFNFCSHDNNMMVINAATTFGVDIWCQNVTVQANTLYTLSTEVSNAISYPVVPQLLFFINNTQIGNLYSPSNLECDWNTFSGTWNSGLATTALVCITNINIESIGNDFAIDNIQLIPNCVYSDEITVTYDEISYNLIDSLEFCSDLPEKIVIETTDTDLNYLWSTSETNDTIFPTITGDYYLTITSGNNCIYKDTTHVDVYTTPIADFSYQILNEDVPFEVEIQNLSQNGLDYNFYFGNGTEMSDNQILSYLQLYPEMGKYQVKLIAENGTCNDTMVKSFSLISTVKIPNIFTPNGDLENDEFFIRNLNNDMFEIQIFNRWGNIVFESTDIHFKWDGKDKTGKECTPGTFFYKAFNYDYLGELVNYQGNIQLVRD